MGYRVKKLVVGKGRTISNEQNGEWVRQYFELEMDIPDEHELVTAKENAEGLLNEWLGITEETPQRKWSWNPDKIPWSKAQGTKGEYERSENADSLDFKVLLKDLAEHKGSLIRDGWFYWSFKNGATVGRKRKVKA